jgi:uncharacterized BrkB/YihY/UPF0761 family membrane protein
MLKKKPLLSSFLSSVIFFAYIAGVSLLLNNMEKIFRNAPKPGVMGGILMLMLFVFSALISGLLLLGGPIYLYAEKEKKTAFKMLSFNITFLALLLFGAALFIYF